MPSNRVYECPAPDCGYEAREISELTEHINSKHPGEYQREDWPDTDAGRAARSRDQADGEDESDEDA